MMVSLIQWRAVIVIFNCRFLGLSKNCNLSINFNTVFETVLLCYHYFESAYIILLTSLYIPCFRLCHGDIELNPASRKLKENTLSHLSLES